MPSSDFDELTKTFRKHGKIQNRSGAAIASGDWREFTSFRNSATADLPPDYSVSQNFILSATHALQRRTGYSQQAKIEDLDPSKTVRVSHQPNAWMGMNIAGSILAACIASSPSPAVFVAIDYDVAGDQRFRSGLVPSVGNTNDYVLAGFVPKSERSKVAFKLERAADQAVSRCASTLLQSADFWSRRLHGRRTTKKFRSKLAQHYRTHPKSRHRLSDQLAIGIADFLEDLLDIRFVVVMASDLFVSVASSLGSLITRLATSNQLRLERAVWRICPKCFQRIPTGITTISTDIAISWSCVSCQDVKSEYLLDPICAGSGPWVVPRVELCNAIDLELLKFRRSISYIGSLAHETDSRWAFMGLNGFLPKGFYWDPWSLDPGFTKENILPDMNGMLLRGKYSTLWYAGLLGGDTIRHMIVTSLSDSMRNP